MAIILKPRRSSAPGAVPTTAQLADGEMAVNTADRKVYMRVGGAIVEVGAPTPKGFIDGLFMEWVSSNSLRVTGGAAYIPSLDTVVEVASAITKSALTLAANSWYHIYLYLASGAPDIEISVTPPASPFIGTARTKGSDTSRRYLGSILTGAANTIYRFSQDGNEVNYITNAVQPFRVLNGGVSFLRTSVSLAPVIPVTSDYVIANTINSADQQLFIDIPEIGNVGALSRYTCLASQRTSIVAAVPSRTLEYLYAVSPSGGAAFIDV